LQHDEADKLKCLQNEKLDGKKLKEVMAELRSFGDCHEDLNDWQTEGLDSTDDWNDEDINKYLPANYARKPPKD